MASEEPVRMFESEPSSFELTELEAPEEELLGSFLPIGDVAKLIGVNPSVLRFWEQEFPQLRPTKRGNRRYYSSEDVQLIRTIQHLLYEEHYTILGARNKIHELQVQDKAREILDEKVSSPLPVVESKKVDGQTEMSLILQELRAIRALLTMSGQVPPQKKSPFELQQEEAVANFSLVSEDLHALEAQQELLKNEETAQMDDKSQETMEELLAPHSYDLGAIGVDGEEVATQRANSEERLENESQNPDLVSLTPADSITETVSSSTQIPVVDETPVESIEPKTETSVDEFLKTEPVLAESNKVSSAQPAQTQTRAKVDTSRLAVPPLPGQRPTFTIGMKVPKSQQTVLTHIAPFLWNKK